MMKLKSKRFCRSICKLGSGNKEPLPKATTTTEGNRCRSESDGIKWELRPGGMLVQKREDKTMTDQSSNIAEQEEFITIRVSIMSHCHHISIQPTSTFGELKMILSLVTSLEPKEQRILFKGKERDDDEYLHMVGVQDKDKVLLLQDPALMEKKKKLLALPNNGAQPISV
ncbi:BAG family molecular chaperone regulator 2-like [Senna tora]|uniref:BAG family molecular chaperone regulator 2-like n=1 Tax=Senna tora TaxID=362788 RepID=A0A834W0Q4_9FABA|nr:BAG family molecular chaperone regulator 2-like [Senna tora]